MGNRSQSTDQAYLARSAPVVSGSVAPGYEGVRDAFEANLASGIEAGGAAFAVFRGGEMLIDLWGGHRDSGRAEEVTESTLFALWSATKGPNSLCVALLVDRGLLAYDVPVAEFWPEFAAHDKETITVGELMSHQAGLPGARETITLADLYGHDLVAALLAAQEPFFRPGTWGYHAFTFGTLADELVRRTDGRTINRFFTEEIAAPLRVDVYTGLPEAHDHRVAETIPLSADAPARGFDPPDQRALEAAIMNPVINFNWPNERHWREHGLPGAGGVASARGLATLYGFLAAGGAVGGQHLISSATLREAIRQRVSGVDQCLGGVGRYGAGFRLNTGWFGSDMAAFGHPGMGGTSGFADARRQLGIAYTTNHMINPDWQSIDPRLSTLLSALYGAECV